MSDLIEAARGRDSAIARRGITFGDLREGRCKYPLGAIEEPPEWFCGEPAPIGKAYCEKCQAKAYTRLERRR